MTIPFILNSALLGAGLAMDAFSVSIVNGLSEPDMRRRRMFMIAGTYAFFQFAMPLIGWILVHTAAQRFALFEAAVPWIALALLSWIGGKMILESVRGTSGDKPQDDDSGSSVITPWTLMMQGIATSIDALSVGFAIADYDFPMALAASLIIAAVTLVLCLLALRLGRAFGTRLADRATLAGGIILVAIGIEIAVTHLI